MPNIPWYNYLGLISFKSEWMTEKDGFPATYFNFISPPIAYPTF